MKQSTKAFADEMEYQYNPRVSVPEYPELAKVRAAQARQVRESATSWLNVPYGKSAREKLDIYAADKAGGPVLVYIHGGYWRSGSKEDNCNFVRLLPSAAPRLYWWNTIFALKSRFGHRPADPRKYRLDLQKYLALQRQSYEAFHFRSFAVGHLTAMVLAHDWEKAGLPEDCIKGAVATSGVYDLEMVMKISVQEQTQLTPEVVKHNSPLLHPPIVRCPLVIAVGGAEPKGWQQMSEDYFNFCKQNGMSAEYLVVPGANHYTMTEKLLDDTNPLTRAMIKLMGI